MPEKKDYYDILGLKKGAGTDEVKQAYKRLAKKYHPDISKEENAEEKFKEILEAYQVLSDPQKKKSYDQFGHAFEGFQGFQGFRGFGARNFEFDFSDVFGGLGGMFGEGFGDIFREAFGARTRAARRGTNIRYDLNISFEEAAFGTEKEISIERIEECAKCGGKGGFGEKQCQHCEGKGRIVRQQRTPFGVFATQSTCGQCNGSGMSYEKTCNECRGKGMHASKKKINVKVPAGIDTGNHLRLQGQGNAGSKGGGAGDLFVVIFIEPHEVFKRDGVDIYAEVPISFGEAVLGAKVEVPTLKGNAIITIPVGTQTGTIFRLKGKGIRQLGGTGFGDAYVKAIVQTPKKMSKKYRQLIQEMAKEESLQKERKSFFQKIGEKFNKF